MLMVLVVAGTVSLLLAEDYPFSIGSTVEEMMNVCMDGANHKSKPGPESELFNHCSPWAKRSCCTEETTIGIGTERAWLNFDWFHCGPLSADCLQQFIKDLCFYECSPNVGPYLQPDKRKIRNQRYQHVPMCQKTCDDWWKVCKSDQTCTDNWAKNFNWSTGINKCPTGAKCRTFQEVFGNANNFCEKIWDNGFKVVPDTEDCFKLWFNEGENPNEAVARREAARRLGLSGLSDKINCSYPFVFLTAFSLLLVFNS